MCTSWLYRTTRQVDVTSRHDCEQGPRGPEAPCERACLVPTSVATMPFPTHPDLPKPSNIMQFTPGCVYSSTEMVYACVRVCACVFGSSLAGATYSRLVRKNVSTVLL